MGCTFEAVVFDWEAAVPDRRRRVAAVRRRVEELCQAGVDVAVITTGTVTDLDGRIGARPGGPGRLMLCARDGSAMYEVDASGPRRLTVPAAAGGDGVSAGRAGVLRAVSACLAERAIGPGLVLVVVGEFDDPGAGDGPALAPEVARMALVSVGPRTRGLPAWVRHLGGGPAMLRRLLDEQLSRRRTRRVPMIDDDQVWTIRETGRDPLRHRVTETLFTLGAGGFATRGSVEETPAGSAPLVLAAGVYTGTGAGQHLLPGPSWTGLSVDPAPEEDRRLLDLRGGLLWREETGAGVPLRTFRFASAARPGVVALRAEAQADRLAAGETLQPPPDGVAARGTVDGRHLDERDRRRQPRRDRGRGCRPPRAARRCCDRGAHRRVRGSTGRCRAGAGGGARRRVQGGVRPAAG
jgi:hypothetical protein